MAVPASNAVGAFRSEPGREQMGRRIPIRIRILQRGILVLDYSGSGEV